MVRILEAFIQPLGIVWGLLILMAIGSVWKRHLRTALASAFGAILLYVFGATSVPARLLASLETPWLNATVDHVTNTVDVVVMLGGVASYSPYDVFDADFRRTVDRVLTAMECIRRGKAHVLVLGGGRPRGTKTPISEGELLTPWVREWLPKDCKIYHLPMPRTTREEGLYFKQLAEKHGWKTLILVTSAAHMRRARGVFRALGFEPYCVACDFIGQAAFLGWKDRPFNPVPNPQNIDLWDNYLHEQIGWIYYRLRGWVKEK